MQNHEQALHIYAPDSCFLECQELKLRACEYDETIRETPKMLQQLITAKDAICFGKPLVSETCALQIVKRGDYPMGREPRIY